MKDVMPEKVCRLCLADVNLKLHIFGEEGIQRKLNKKILNCLSLIVSEDDEFPKYMCHACHSQLENFDIFRKCCHESEKVLKSFETSSADFKDESSSDQEVSEMSLLSPCVQLTEAVVTGGSRPEVNFYSVKSEREDIRMNYSSPSGSPEPCSWSVKGIAARNEIPSGSTHNSLIKAAECMDSCVGVVNSWGNKVDNIDSNSISESVAGSDNGDQGPVDPHQQKVSEMPDAPKKHLVEGEISQAYSEHHEVFNSQCEADSKVDEERSSINIPMTQSNGGVMQWPLFHSILQQHKQLSGQLGLGGSNGKAGDGPPISVGSFSQMWNFQSHRKVSGCEKSYVCEQCNKVFSQQATLLLHVRTHTGEKPFVCEMCDKRFAQQGTLHAHLRTHTGEKPYVCEICNKAFTQQGTLTLHIRVHTGEKPYVCDLCNKRFAQQGTLNAHLRTHTGEKPFVCEICNKSFAQQGTLVLHLRTHTGERPYVCEICNKAFAQLGTLNLHLRTHTGERPFVCEVCNKSFTQQGTLSLHMKIHKKITSD